MEFKLAFFEGIRMESIPFRGFPCLTELSVLNQVVNAFVNMALVPSHGAFGFACALAPIWVNLVCISSAAIPPKKTHETGYSSGLNCLNTVETWKAIMLTIKNILRHSAPCQRKTCQTYILPLNICMILNISVPHTDIICAKCCIYFS